MFSGINRCTGKVYVLKWVKRTYMSLHGYFSRHPQGPHSATAVAVWGSKRLMCFLYLSSVVLHLGRLNAIKWLKWFRRISDDKSMGVNLTPLCISVMYNLLDFHVSLHPSSSHKVVNEIFLFCYCQSLHLFHFWNSSLISSYPSVFAICCAQSMQISASEPPCFFLWLLLSVNLVIHILVQGPNDII